jgi:hypothetical protein
MQFVLDDFLEPRLRNKKKKNKFFLPTIVGFGHKIRKEEVNKK